MALCQSLYEAGYITYHRTDCQAFSKEFKQVVSKYIEKTYGIAYVVADANADVVADAHANANADTNANAHEAIRPTNIEWNAEDKGKEYRLYNLIRRRALESSMPAASISVLTAGINAPQNYTYHFTAEHIIFAGWLIANEKSSTASVSSTTSTTSEYTYLQTLKPLSSLPPKKIKAALHLTETKQHYTEAKLVNLLETKGIGRPSTFASIIDKIQERGYVKKENVPGQMLSCVDYEMSEGVIKTTQAEREFGGEKNKLVITPVGILALEFLLKHFDPFFQYTYTKEMEDDLDLVVQGTTVWHSICQKYYTDLEHLSSNITERGKEIIRIDAEHTYMIGKYGPVIKHQAGDKKKTVTFKAVRKDLDLNKLRNGDYSLAEVLHQASAGQGQVQGQVQGQEPSIGTHQDKPVYIKVGKFGKYLEWNGMNKSLKHLKMKPDEITMDDVIELLFDTENELENTRVLTPDATIKKGKYGYYIYYKNKKMKKPRFLKLDGFKGDYLTCDIETIKEWFEKTYWGETPHAPLGASPHTPH
jgi:DNA topoisomerase-1